MTPSLLLRDRSNLVVLAMAIELAWIFGIVARLLVLDYRPHVWQRRTMATGILGILGGLPTAMRGPERRFQVFVLPIHQRKLERIGSLGLDAR